MNRIKDFDKNNMKKVPAVKPGDTVRVHTKIREGNKERVQIFEGVVIKKQGGNNVGASITVRKISYGIGVERTFLLHSPLIEKINVTKRARVRRANIGYLRELTGKSAKLKEKQFDALAVNIKEEELSPADKAEIEKEVDEEEPVEISEDVLSQADTLSTEDLEKKEDEKIDGDEDAGPVAEDEQKDAQEEVSEGLEKAEEDLEKGKAKEGKKAEKTSEDKKGKEEEEEDKGTEEGQGE